MKEIWKAIPLYQGYEVSNLGRIRSYNKVTSSAKFKERHWKDRIIHQKWQKGYARVDLWSNQGKHRTLLVSRLVALAFVSGHSIDKNIVNHLSGDPHDNRATNLEWTDYSGNLIHAYKHGLNKENKFVLLKNKFTGTSKIFLSMAKASLFLGKNAHFISALCQKGCFEFRQWEIKILSWQDFNSRKETE